MTPRNWKLAIVYLKTLADWIAMKIFTLRSEVSSSLSKQVRQKDCGQHVTGGSWWRSWNGLSHASGRSSESSLCLSLEPKEAVPGIKVNLEATCVLSRAFSECISWNCSSDPFNSDHQSVLHRQSADCCACCWVVIGYGVCYLFICWSLIYGTILRLTALSLCPSLHQSCMHV